MSARSCWGRLSLCFLLVCAAPLSAAAQGEADEEWFANGWYVGLGGMYGVEFRADEAMGPMVEAPLGAGIGASVDDSPGFASRLGWRQSSWLAAELQLDYLAGFDVRAQGIDWLSYRLLVMTVNAKFAAPMLGRLQPYGVVGVGLSKSWIDTSFALDGAYAAMPNLQPPDDGAVGAAVRGGIGFDLYIAHGVALTTEASYVFPTGDNEKLDYLALEFGFSYSF